MYNWSNQSQYSFMPTAWVSALGGEDSQPWAGLKGWWAEYPVICWFQLNTKDDGVKGSLFLYSEVGPIADPDDRKYLIECIQKCAKGKLGKQIKFRADATRSGARYSKFFNGNSTAIADISDAEAIEAGMRKLLLEFGAAIKAVEPALIEFAEYMEGEDV